MKWKCSKTKVYLLYFLHLSWHILDWPCLSICLSVCLSICPYTNVTTWISGSKETHSADHTKKIKDEYEKKIGNLQGEMKKLQAAKKEHAKLLRNQSHYEKQLKTLQRDLGDMKRVKVGR